MASKMASNLSKIHDNNKAISKYQQELKNVLYGFHLPNTITIIFISIPIYRVSQKPPK
jgi:membrane-bound acyltransferase YfiQ involved in biofilm formation